ncbi:hypothetical protein F53441_12557 [Fusarium austroafricanum]|uniref:Apple domain-containing protein n=1 Tax=Fusarium austroafricanum TaxID=2364996 RepID=A0A8H4JWY7_9HYPO|nr:hypothetical protein F53441_12557 [Fusarium austroafricanum]
MKPTLFSTLLLPLLSSLTLAGDGDDDVICQTKLGTKSIATVDTKTVTKTDPITPNNHVFSTKTFTVTGEGDADTFNTTTTIFKVATVKVVATTTTTTTKTGTKTTTSTTNIPTTKGSQFISDTVNSRSLGSAKQRDNVAKSPHARALIKPGMKGFTFPQEVVCTKFLPNPRTKTVQKTGAPVTKAATTIQTTTIVKTISTTKTLIPKDISVTKTFSTTMKVTTYSTTWKTSTKPATATKTKVISGPTSYAACAQENMFGPNFNADGTGYFVTNVLNNGPGIPSDFQIVANGASDAGECCTSCMQFAGCETWTFRAVNRNCFLLYHAGSTCKSQNNHPNYFMSKKGEAVELDLLLVMVLLSSR